MIAAIKYDTIALEKQCALEIVDPEIVSPEIVNSEIVSPEIVNPGPDIVNLEILNFGREGAIRRQGEIGVTSDSIRKDLKEGPVWTQG